jgi:hypothetical protein
MPETVAEVSIAKDLAVPYGLLSLCAAVVLTVSIVAGTVLSTVGGLEYSLLQRLAALQSVTDPMAWGLAVVSMIAEKGSGKRFAALALGIWVVAEVVVLVVGQARISVGTYW